MESSDWGRLVRTLDKSTGALLLKLWLVPLFVSVMVSLFGGHFRLFALKTVGLAFWSLAAALVSRGIREEIDYEEASIARAPKPPKKILGALLLGVGVFYLGCFVGAAPLWKSLIVALLATAGTLLYYGLDPREDKLPESDEVSGELLFRSLSEARDTLETIRLHSRDISDLRLHREIEHALEKAERILAAIEEDPAALRLARKFLVVYLDGVARVTERYRNLREEEIDEEMRKRLYTLLQEVQRSFDRELERLRSDERFDLEVQIDALREQLRN